MRSFLLLALLIVCTPLSYAASVWKVSKGEQQLFIGGTIHVLSKADYPLPDAYDKAYQKANTLVFETDLQEAMSPAFQQKSLMLMSYQDGTTVDKVLSADTLEKLNVHLKSRNIPFQNIQFFKPSLLSLVLSFTELQLKGLTQEGVDAHYFAKAGQDSKARHWLETPDQQLDFIKSMGVGREDELISYTLKDISNLPTLLNGLLTTWREGDMQGMADLTIAQMKQDYPDIYQNLIVKRNNNWMPKVLNMLATPEQEFILVGALHLAGPDSVLTKLKSQGYKIEEL